MSRQQWLSRVGKHTGRWCRYTQVNVRGKSCLIFLRDHRQRKVKGSQSSVGQMDIFISCGTTCPPPRRVLPVPLSQHCQSAPSCRSDVIDGKCSEILAPCLDVGRGRAPSPSLFLRVGRRKAAAALPPLFFVGLLRRKQHHLQLLLPCFCCPHASPRGVHDLPENKCSFMWNIGS